MANIAKELQKILDAVYGEEVRGSIHDGMVKMNQESEYAVEQAVTAKDSAKNSAAAAKQSETNAANSASTASTKASQAATSATNAATSATNAANSASTASTKASQAATSATNAANSASAASTSATNAANSASTASTKASQAATSATNAATSATNAANSASTASTKASQAATSATNAANSASAASTSATNAANSASTASTKASQAATSATNAQNAAENAAEDAVAKVTELADPRNLFVNRGELAEGSDLNNYLKPGYYICGGNTPISNLPDNASKMRGCVLVFSIPYNAGPTTYNQFQVFIGDYNYYIRGRLSGDGNFTKWSSIFHNDLRYVNNASFDCNNVRYNTCIPFTHYDVSISNGPNDISSGPGLLLTFGNDGSYKAQIFFTSSSTYIRTFYSGYSYNWNKINYDNKNSVYMYRETLQGTNSDPTDLNTLTKNGLYFANGCKLQNGTTSGVNTYRCLIMNTRHSYKSGNTDKEVGQQTMFGYDGTVYTRYLENGTWTAWNAGGYSYKGITSSADNKLADGYYTGKQLSIQIGDEYTVTTGVLFQYTTSYTPSTPSKVIQMFIEQYTPAVIYVRNGIPGDPPQWDSWTKIGGSTQSENTIDEKKVLYDIVGYNFADTSHKDLNKIITPGYYSFSHYAISSSVKNIPNNVGAFGLLVFGFDRKTSSGASSIISYMVCQLLIGNSGMICFRTVYNPGSSDYGNYYDRWSNWQYIRHDSSVINSIKYASDLSTDTKVNSSIFSNTAKVLMDISESPTILIPNNLGSGTNYDYFREIEGLQNNIYSFEYSDKSAESVTIYKVKFKTMNIYFKGTYIFNDCIFENCDVYLDWEKGSQFYNCTFINCKGFTYYNTPTSPQIGAKILFDNCHFSPIMLDLMNSIACTYNSMNFIECDGMIRLFINNSNTILYSSGCDLSIKLMSIKNISHLTMKSATFTPSDVNNPNFFKISRTRDVPIINNNLIIENLQTGNVYLNIAGVTIATSSNSARIL